MNEDTQRAIRRLTHRSGIHKNVKRVPRTRTRRYTINYNFLGLKIPQPPFYKIEKLTEMIK